MHTQVPLNSVKLPETGSYAQSIKEYFFLFYIKFPIAGYITRPYWFWSLNSVFEIWRLIFTFLTHKSIFILAPCKIPDRWMFFFATCKIFDRWKYHTAILILGLGGLFLPFWTSKVYYYFIYTKFPIVW
jgi:hypothetical protein